MSVRPTKSYRYGDFVNIYKRSGLGLGWGIVYGIRRIHFKKQKETTFCKQS